MLINEVTDIYGVVHELRENTSKVYYTGRTFETHNCGTATIIGQCKEPTKYTRMRKGKLYTGNAFIKFVIQFEDATVIILPYACILDKSAYNPMKKTKYGIGYRGPTTQAMYDNPYYGKITDAWENMFRRCYDDALHELEPSYKECEVEEYWHNFVNFYNSIEALPNYDEWKDTPFMALDKDKIVKGNKLYARHLCMFLTKSDNTKERWVDYESPTYFCTCGASKLKYSKHCKKCSDAIRGERCRKVVRPSSDELLSMIRTQPFECIARIYNVSSNSVRKWCKSYNLPYKKAEIMMIKH